MLVGGILNTLVRNANRVKIVCLAQLVNVIAPIMTNSKGSLRQTILYPYRFALQFARCNVLSLLVRDPAMFHTWMLPVPQNGEVSGFILNRDLNNARTVQINWQDKAPSQIQTSTTLTGTDLKAFNSFDVPKNVTPQALDKPSTAGGRTKFEVPARSYTVIQQEERATHKICAGSRKRLLFS